MISQLTPDANRQKLDNWSAGEYDGFKITYYLQLLSLIATTMRYLITNTDW